MRTLVIGGTGPSGYSIVQRLLARGDAVTIFHTGSHEVPFSGPVEHLHGNPRQLEDLQGLLGSRRFDLAISTSGRIRHVVEALRGRVRKLVAVSGLAVYQGSLILPGEVGLQLPIREEDPLVTQPPGERATRPEVLGYLATQGERLVMEAHARGDFDASILRYTMVYGPYSYIPFEWFLVRRILDGRRVIALEDGGLMVPQRGYSENLAQAALLAADHPAASGEIYNVGDERVLSLRSITVLVAEALGASVEIVDVPLELSPCQNPMALRQNTFFDLSKIRFQLGYRDVVSPQEATRLTALWLRENPIARGGPEELSLGPSAFDYQAEDTVIRACRDLYARLPRPQIGAGPSTGLRWGVGPMPARNQGRTEESGV